MGKILGIREKGKFLLSNEPFSVIGDVNSGTFHYGAGCVNNIASYGSHIPDTIQVDEIRFIQIFDLMGEIEPGTMYEKDLEF